MPAFLFLFLIAGGLLFYVLAVRRGESRFWSAVFALLLGPFALPLLWRSGRSTD